MIQCYKNRRTSLPKLSKVVLFKHNETIIIFKYGNGLMLKVLFDNGSLWASKDAPYLFPIEALHYKKVKINPIIMEQLNTVLKQYYKEANTTRIRIPLGQVAPYYYALAEELRTRTKTSIDNQLKRLNELTTSKEI